jgi:hypothetical protein
LGRFPKSRPKSRSPFTFIGTPPDPTDAATDKKTDVEMDTSEVDVESFLLGILATYSLVIACSFGEGPFKDGLLGFSYIYRMFDCPPQMGCSPLLASYRDELLTTFFVNFMHTPNCEAGSLDILFIISHGKCR